MLLLTLITLSLANSKHQERFLDNLKKNKYDLIEDDNSESTQYNISDNGDKIDSPNAMTVNTKMSEKEVTDDKTDILGDHFLVLRESVRRPETNPSSYSLTRRQGLMESIVQLIETTRKVLVLYLFYFFLTFK